jgi:cell wall-associated NlpC family hydrolase
MMIPMKKIFLLIILFLTFGLQSFAQDRKVDVLELLYKQKNYRTILRKTDRLINKRGYEDNELVHLFQAVALAKLSQDSRYLRSHPNTLGKSTDAFENYYELDKQLGFVQRESVLLVDLQKIYKASKSVSIKSDAYAYVMIESNEPQVIQKEQVIIVKNKEGNKVDYPEDFKASEVDTVCEIAYFSEEDKMITYAKKFIGVPYRYGGTGDGGFDCSGYTQYILNTYGHQIPRSARTQHGDTESIKVKHAKKGDLIFFSKNKRKSNITHVGIVISEEGENLTMIHASSSRGIMITDVSTNSYWKPKLVAAGRPKKQNNVN